jgi:hypothetical protein
MKVRCEGSLAQIVNVMEPVMRLELFPIACFYEKGYA